MPAASKGSAGVGVDAHGGAVIDPTANVQALSEASNKRQDDLREATNRLYDAKINHLEQTALLRAQHSQEMREAESDRLNSIRQVDVLAVSTAAERSLAAIQTLAVTTAANAENLRNALTATASTIAAQTANTVAGLSERITNLEKSSYDGKGKSTVADPQMVELIAEMRSLRTRAASEGGKQAGMSTMAGVILGAVTFVSTLLAIGSVVYSVVKH
jgi:hypothetical protein